MLLKSIRKKKCHISINIHTPEQKYKTTYKNEEKDIVYNFQIIKIRYMKDKVYRQLDFRYEEMSIHFLYDISINSFFFFNYLIIRPLSRTIEYKGNFLI